MADVGRPTKMTPEVIGKLEEIFALDGTVKEACFYAGINPDTYYTFVKDNPKYSERFDALREQPVLQARRTVVASLRNPDNAFRYLERKKKDEFSVRVENTGKDGEALIPQPILGNLNVISANNSYQSDSSTIEANQSDTGRNISEQDDLDTPIADSSSSERQETHTDERSI